MHNSNEHPWRVLILGTGYDRETLRGVVEQYVRSLGFSPVIYDSAGYPADPSLHSHAACVRAISQVDICIGLVDEKLGGEFQLAEAPPEMRAGLVAAGIFESTDATDHGISITQVEIQVARHLAKPTLVFIPKEIEAAIQSVLRLLKDGAITLKPKSGTTVSAVDLIARRDWKELDKHFVVPGGHIDSFGQLLFIEYLRKSAPNFIYYYDKRQPGDLCVRVESSLSSVALMLLQTHQQSVISRIQKLRNPLSKRSLHDLYTQGMIIEPPVRNLSGYAAVRPVWQEMAESLRGRKSVLLVGDPGLGKTTASFFCYKQMTELSASDLSAPVPMYARFLELDVVPESADELIRRLIGEAGQRDAWPAKVRLPEVPYVFILDGLDEAVDRSRAADLIVNLSAHHPIVVSCRRSDFERSFRAVNSSFHRIIELRPWGDREISAYIAALRISGIVHGADLITEWRRLGAVPEILSLPLWLSMIAFLAEEEFERTGDPCHVEPLDEYELLRRCSDAVARQELARHHAAVKVDDLFRWWSEIAWAVHTARRERRALPHPELLEIIGYPVDSPVYRAVVSSLNVFGTGVRGFFHEVFNEYWLAYYLTERILGDVSAGELAQLLMYQRSVVTNRLLRNGLQKNAVDKVASRLRDAFWSAQLAGHRSVFVKNQLVYLLGRIDRDGPATRSFLLRVWNSDENAVVRHSAAFALTMAGEQDVESEFYHLLVTSAEDDQINRGYHLYYYGDLDVPEQDVPTADDGTCPADGTLRQLYRRLGRNEDRHLRLRRVELLTIRRFLETGRRPPLDIELGDRVASTLRIAASVFGDVFAQDVRAEAERILHLLRT